MNTTKKYVQNRLNAADIKINGDRPFDIQVKDERFYNRILLNGSLGLGEAYMDGWWDCPQLDEFFNRIFKIAPYEKTQRFKNIGLIIKSAFSNMQSGSKSSKVVNKHYDLGNELFKNTLDKRLLYTCAYWKDADNLDAAQEAKLDLICRKLNLKPGQKVLDIGCGWGALICHAARSYGVTAHGITLSEQQLQYTRQRIKKHMRCGRRRSSHLQLAQCKFSKYFRL
ncbi:MAG: class I SAM-dependent methyltransferase [Candidatus Marinimicrobia bacterium]|nr:class I SAM-dependent methyltransferase [Candidatus Neomarinimicrobiota bacterium]